MTITKLQRTVVDALEDIKAQDIRVFNTTGLSDLFDRVVVASATSNRQTRSLATHVREKAKEKGFDVISTEGEDTGEWVLVDLGDIVVHIMQPAIRAYYNLEELWGAKPVRMRIGGDSLARPRVAAASSAPQASSKPRGGAKPLAARKASRPRAAGSAAASAVRPAATATTAQRRVRAAGSGD